MANVAQIAPASLKKKTRGTMACALKNVYESLLANLALEFHLAVPNQDLLM